MDEFKCNPFAARIVELFSEDGSGIIPFQKFINIFSVFSPRATNETKTVWAFAIWDFDGVLPAAVPIDLFPGAPHFQGHQCASNLQQEREDTEHGAHT